jgi:hypothetical protein
MRKETVAEELKALRAILLKKNDAILDQLKKVERELKELKKKKVKSTRKG